MRYRKRKIAGRTYSLHRLVWIQAHGPIPDGFVIHYRNHDRLDNRLENLELLTHQQHVQHHNQKHPRTQQCEVCDETFEPAATKRGRARTCSRPCMRVLLSRQRQENNGMALLNPEKVVEIRRRLAAGEQGKRLAAEFGVSQVAISGIKTGRSWGHVQ